MSFSYDPDLTADSDMVRFLTGDILADKALRSNEEIAGVLAREPNVYRAASMICDSLSAQFSREADSAIDDMRKSLSQRARAYADRALRLDARAESSTGTRQIVPIPYAGGISVSDKRSRSSDSDRVPPFFDREDMDFQDSIRHWTDGES